MDMEKKKQKVLIVDDDQFLINMYSLKFSNEGFEVSSATKGEESLDKLRGGLEPDIILLDVVMPSLGGIGILEKIRREKLAEKSFVIMLTNQGDRSDIDQANKLGVDGYIVKATSTPSGVVEEVMNIYNRVKNN
ncbi:MAG: response regulator [Patescibacteria group bacterium]|nr:response regulator [Patescibacteria group bacterium]MDE1988690.1 response regulator [Patescibacteria group bacterium]MDE2218243.1 response regulator [Patescibacteria group bacterium]